MHHQFVQELISVSSFLFVYLAIGTVIAFIIYASIKNKKERKSCPVPAFIIGWPVIVFFGSLYGIFIFTMWLFEFLFKKIEGMFKPNFTTWVDLKLDRFIVKIKRSK